MSCYLDPWNLGSGMIGKTISHYRIHAKLGEGGMGVVYKAEDTSLRRTVALKFLSPSVIDNPDAKARLVHEAQAAAALRHPNLCTVHEITEVEGQTFIAMAYIDGQSLKEHLATGSMSVAESLDIVRQVGTALKKAHQHGIVHRDIKPANIMVDADGMAVLTDFGLAVMEDATRLTRTGTTLGTVAYMAPEQVRGEEVSPQSDIHSLGAILYEMLTGHLPFGGDREATVIHAILNTLPAPLASYRVDLPGGLQPIIDKALAKDTAERYADIQEFLDDLQRVQQGQPVSGVSRTRARMPWRTITSVGLGAILALATFFVLKNIISTRDEPAATSPHLVAILPFAVQGSTEIQYLRNGLVNLLGERLDGVGPLTTVPLAKVLDIERGQGENRHTQGHNEIARQLGAEFYVTGSVVEAGGQLSFAAALHRAANGQKPLLTTTAEGYPGRTLGLVDDLATDLLVELFRQSCDSVTPLACASTDSFAALQYYLNGEHQFRTGNFNPAVEAFQAAVAADSTFALAYYRQARAASFTPIYYDRVITGGTLQKALRYGQDLPGRIRDLMAASHARYIEIDPEKALRLLRRVVSRYPDDLEANFLLGELCQDYGECHGPDQEMWFEEAKGAFDRVLACEPNHLQTIIQLNLLASKRRAPREYLALAERRLELAPNGYYAPLLRTQIAFARDDTAAQQHCMNELRGSDDFLARWTAEELAEIHENFSAATQVVLLTTEPPRDPQTRARAYFVLAQIAAASGRWHEAQAHLAAAEPHFQAEAIEARSVYALVPQLELPSEVVDDILHEVASLPEMYDAPWAAQVHRAYISGLLRARQGDMPAAEKHVRDLESLADEARARGTRRHEKLSVMVGNLTHCVRAEAARTVGDLAIALAHMDRIDEVAAWGFDLYGPLTAEGWQYARYLRAELLAQTGLDSEALRWFDILGSVVYKSPRHIRMGEIYERLGDTERAAEHYRLFLALWENCDPHLQPKVAEIRQRLTLIEP